MSVAVLITEERECAHVIPWAMLFARAHDEELRIVFPKRASRKSGWSEIREGAAESGTEQAILASIAELQPPEFAHSARQDGLRAQPGAGKLPESTERVPSNGSKESSPNIRAQRFLAPDPGTSLAKQIHEQSIRLLLIPEFSFTRASGEASEWQGVLLKHAPCATVCLRADAIPDVIRALVVVQQTEDDQIALQQAAELVRVTGGSLTAVIVVPNLDDEVSIEIGQRKLQSILKQALGRRAKEVNCLVRVNNSVTAGLGQVALSEYDFVMAAARREKAIAKLLYHDSVPDHAAQQRPTMATIRSGQNLRGRMRRSLSDFLQRYVPQLTREQRVDLVSRVQASSEWDLDFAALIFLSALIAGLGLIQNSVAVVIGAMLVAPLMTPIIGAGLGLAQCNLRLIQVSFRTIYRGFATAFVIGMLLGWLACDTIGSEMTSRGAPNFLDLLVAFASGLAAAYALGRPSLSSALPGVAIAAALVPPLATSGIAAAKYQWPLAWGALLLFLTNIVAICLGTTIVFSAVGIRRMGKDDTKVPAWPRWVLMSLVIVTVFLTALIHFNNYPIGRPTVDQFE